MTAGSRLLRPSAIARQPSSNPPARYLTMKIIYTKRLFSTFWLLRFCNAGSGNRCFCYLDVDCGAMENWGGILFTLIWAS